MRNRSRCLAVMGLVAGLLICMTSSASGDVFQAAVVGVKGPAMTHSNASLNGTYRFRSLSFENMEDPDKEAGLVTGTMTFDGAGNCSGTYVSSHSDGTSESGAYTAIYSVNSDGSFVFTLADASGGDTWAGTFSKDDGRNMLWVTQGEAEGGDVFQSLLVAVKPPATAPTLASLNGTYQFRNLSVRDVEGAEPDSGVTQASVVFDGAGNWSAAYMELSGDGVSESGTMTGTYMVNGNSFDFTETGGTGVGFSADLSADGNVLILSAFEVDGGEIGMWLAAAVKQGPGAAFSNADLTGTYSAGMLMLANAETDDREAFVFNTFINFDGAGTYSVAFSAFSSDGMPFSGTGTGTYAVNPDGSFTLTQTSQIPNHTYSGNISPDGEAIILSRAEHFIGDGGFLLLDLGAWGLYGHDGANLTFLSPANPHLLAATSSGVALAFEGYGVFTFDGSVWGYIAAALPESMVAWGDLLVADFGIYGVYSYDGTTWTQIVAESPDLMAVWDGKLILSYDGIGVFTYDGTAWGGIAAAGPESMLSWGDLFVMDYGLYGVWGYNTGGWTPITASDPEDMIVWDSLLVMDLGTTGIMGYDGTSWSTIDASDPESMLAWGNFLILDYGDLGLYAFDLSQWTLITEVDCEGMIVGRFD